MKSITIDSVLSAPVRTVWEHWTNTDSIVKWNQASPDWHCPKAFNNLKVGDRFSYTMAAKDGSTRFNFEGTYTKVEKNKAIEFTPDDNRTVKIVFTELEDNLTKITETFEMESENSEELQRKGWAAILENFKKVCETATKASPL